MTTNNKDSKMKIEYNVTGKTVEEAYQRAVELYSAYGEIAMEEIISRGKKGFLGIFGAVPAEIRISVDDGKEERPQSREKSQQRPQSKEKPQQKSQGKEREPKAQLVERQNQPKKKAEAKPQVAEQPVAEKPKQVKKQTIKPQEREPIKDEDIKVTAKEKTLVMDFLKSFIANVGLDCEVTGDLTEFDGYVSRIVTIEGAGASTLIGHHGETLDSIQYLANLCLARKSDSDHKEYVKVIVDIEGYRAKREQTLRSLARKMSEKALRQNRSVHLEPMNPYERRIVHSEVQKIAGVSTHSIGYDENRKIVITVDKKA
jgi:spoIIIJ-associated protein